MKKSTLFTRLLPVLLLACALLAAPQDIRAQGPDPVVKLETSMGDILVRLDARKAKNFAESDRIRDALAAQGVILQDGPTGTTWRRG